MLLEDAGGDPASAETPADELAEASIGGGIIPGSGAGLDLWVVLEASGGVAGGRPVAGAISIAIT